MVNIPPTALDIAFEAAQKAYDTVLKTKRQFTQGLDARDALNGNVKDAEEKLFGKGGFANSIQALPDEERIAFAKKALETVKLGSKGKTNSIALQTAYISNVVEVLEKYRGATPISFAETLRDNLDTTLAMPLNRPDARRPEFAATLQDDLRPTEAMPLPAATASKGPHISKASLDYAAGQAFDTMVNSTPKREAAFRKANQGQDKITDADIMIGFNTRLADATGYLFHDPDSVMARLQKTQSSGQVKLVLDAAYNGLPRQSKTMQPLIEETLDSFVAALKKKETQFSYQKPGLQRGA